MSGKAASTAGAPADRVLQRLAQPGSYLAPLAAGGFGLFARRNQWRAPLARLSAEAVALLVQMDLVRPPREDEEAPAAAWLISEAGAARLRRLQRRDDPFRGQHAVQDQRVIGEPGRTARLRTVNAGESPIGWLSKRKGADGQPLLSAEQVEAGEKLRRDFTLGHLTPRVTADWTAVPSRGRRQGGDMTAIADSALAARDRVHRALAAVGPGLSDLLVAVCCHLIGLEEAEREFGWPRRSGKVVLQIALTRLADHYGLTPAPRRARMRLWCADDPAET